MVLYTDCVPVWLTPWPLPGFDLRQGQCRTYWNYTVSHGRASPSTVPNILPTCKLILTCRVRQCQTYFSSNSTALPFSSATMILTRFPCSSSIRIGPQHHASHSSSIQPSISSSASYTPCSSISS